MLCAGHLNCARGFQRDHATARAGSRRRLSSSSSRRRRGARCVGGRGCTDDVTDRWLCVEKGTTGRGAAVEAAVRAGRRRRDCPARIDAPGHGAAATSRHPVRSRSNILPAVFVPAGAVSAFKNACVLRTGRPPSLNLRGTCTHNIRRSRYFGLKGSEFVHGPGSLDSIPRFLDDLRKLSAAERQTVLKVHLLVSKVTPAEQSRAARVFARYARDAHTDCVRACVRACVRG